ncbi:MAG: PD40 domain-containing protein [Bacteroidetes bacterium]|nr:PD40 domain-containing protein [Bacteroidota bacterium]
MKKIFYILSILLTANAFAQNVEFTKDNFKDNKDGYKEAKKNLEIGDDLFAQGSVFYRQALDPYLLANKFNPNNALLNYKIGKCYLYSSTKLKSIPFLEKAIQLDANVDPQIHYVMGKAYHLDMQWDKAILEFKKFQSTITKPSEFVEIIEDVNKHIEECNTGKDLVKNPIRVFIDNVGPEINTSYPEYGPIISADESVMMFTSRRAGTTGGGMDEYLNEPFEDIYVSFNKGGKWSTAQNIGKPINTEGHDATMGLAPDGQKLLIYIDEKGNGNIFECDLKGSLWSKPERMNKNVNTDYHESSASLASDGKRMFFVSNRPDGMGDRDIYMSTMDEKGKWGKAVNLGPTINTKYGEEGIYIHPDGRTIYFSSQAHKTMGGYDIFKSVYDEATKTWSTPENLGYPVNTPDDDVFFVVSASGKHGYYASINGNGYGEKDIYMVTFLGAEKPMVMNNEDNLLASQTAPVKETVIAPVMQIKEAQLTILKGVITDAMTKKPLEATIELVDNTKNMVVATFTSNSATGKYLVSLPAGRNYGIAVKKEGYLFHSENFDIPATAAFQEVTKDVELKNVAVGSKIILKNIFFDFDKATLRPESTNELERLTKLLQDVPTLKIEIGGHTDSKGADDYNKKLSDNRAKAVVTYLIGKGIAADRLTSAGYGEEQPIATNDTDEGRQMNRRTEFKILSK